MATHGYVGCACRDCFDVAVCSAALGEAHKPEDHLCGGCADAGCLPDDGECQRTDAYGDPDADEPDTDAGDWTTDDHRTFYQYGRAILTVPEGATETEMWIAIRAAMSAANFWPNVWFVSDHGNAHRLIAPKS